MSQQPSQAATNVIGKVIANTTIERKLGAGGMGAVFAGRHHSLNRIVALKLLPAVPPPPAQFVQRFFREAEAMRQLEHPHIVRVYDYGQEDPFYYIVMEFVQARPLEEIVREKNQQKDRVKISRALRIIRDVADAMAYCHELNILHRDLKPDNILLNEQTSEVKIIDFGLVKVEGGDAQALTVTGQIMGTPMYMAPEQAEGKVADHRTDIYSLGACGFFFLTGDFPFKGRSGMDILLKKIKENPRDMRELRPEIPKPVADLIHRMMARDPAKRFQSMGRVRDILNQALKPRGAGGEAGAGKPNTGVSSGKQPAAGGDARQQKRPAQPQPRPQRPAAHPQPAKAETRQVSTNSDFRISESDAQVPEHLRDVAPQSAPPPPPRRNTSPNAEPSASPGSGSQSGASQPSAVPPPPPKRQTPPPPPQRPGTARRPQPQKSPTPAPRRRPGTPPPQR